jgi:hypothetical protein
MTQHHLLLVAAPVAGLALYAVSHVALARLMRGRGPYAALVTAFIPGLACALLATCAALRMMKSGRADWVAYLALNVTTYAALGWGYFHFVNLGIASLRIRILEELVDAGGELPAESLGMLYNDEEVITMRIRRLCSGRHLVEHDGRYRIGSRRFLAIARIFDGLRALIFGGSRGPTHP